MPSDYELRVTRRALADIGWSHIGGAAFDLEANRGRHPILKAFASKRGHSPTGQERTLGIKAPVYNLHARNPWRGVTWFDEQAGVCWLLGVTAHDYAEFVSRAKTGELTPTEQDYADLDLARSPLPRTLDETEVLERIREDGASLVVAAFAAPNTEIVGGLARALDVALFVEVILTVTDGVDLHVAFKMPPHPGVPLPGHLVEVCVAAMLPSADPFDIDWNWQGFPSRDPSPGEYVVRWRRPPD